MENLENLVFDNGDTLTVLEILHKNGRKFYVCKCSHNEEKIIRSDQIRHRKSCGCNNDTLPPGKKIGRLTVINRDKKTRKVLCLCDCGNETVVYDSNLFRENTFSCGCLHKEVFNNKKHGHAERSLTSITYRSWTMMKNRCLNPNSTQYKWYGARGITVCKRWLNFENFLKDMGERPDKSLSIDRIDNEKGYDKENCKWSTAKEQCNNRRKKQ